jgi:tetratricopeptide (TPR) repeat protein
MKNKTGAVALIIGLMFTSCATSQQRLAKEREKDPQYQYEKAVVCMQAGLFDEAFKYLNQTLTLDPRHALALNLLGLAHMMKGNAAEAVKAFERCLAINSGFSEGHNNLGTAYQELGSLDRAEEEYQKAFALDQNYNASYNLAKLYFLKKNMDMALDYVRKSLQKYSRSVIAWNLQGLIYDEQGKLDEAISSYQEALKLAHDELNVSYNLGVAYFKKENYAKAQEIMDRILSGLAQTPPSAQAQDLRTKANELLKRIKEATKK